MPSKIKLYDKDGNLKSIDEILALEDGALATLTHVEREAHGGHAFTITAVSAVLGDAATLNVAFKTPDVNTRIHFMTAFSTLIGGYLQIIEAPTWTAGSGTATTMYNRLRDENPILSKLLEDDTVEGVFTATNKVLVDVADLAGGTAIWTRYAWGEKGKTEAAPYRAENEFLLKHNTQYAVLFTAIGAANRGQIFLNWIEHKL